jgi:hypothetical protein
MARMTPLPADVVFPLTALRTIDLFTSDIFDRLKLEAYLV